MNHGRKKPALWVPHLDGVPHRKLGNHHSLTGAQIYNRIEKELSQLPKNETLTKSLCNPARFSGILVMDGKYVKVKGFEQKIPLIYGIDYLTHDIPYGGLFVAEDSPAFYSFFEGLRTTGYPLRMVVADDRSGLESALNNVFPLRPLQLCHTHYLENIKKLLDLKSSPKEEYFFNSLNLHVFVEPRTKQQVITGLKSVWERHAKRNRHLTNIILDIRDRIDYLFYYLRRNNCPRTINLIESYNSHLQGRLKTIKGFQSFSSAQRWLNAYLIRRRTKELTDCNGKFRHLNQHASLELTIQKQAQWPEILTKLGIGKVKYYEKNSRKKH